MDIDALKERLAKMKALADCGTGGERTAADRLIHKICAKYGISIDDIDTEIEREHTVEVSNSWQWQIFLQLLGLMRIEQYGDRNSDKLHLFMQKRPGGHRGRGKSRRQTWVKRYFTVCTDAQWLELSAKFDVLCFDYTKQLKAFPLAFLMSNDLLMPFDPDKPHTAPDEQYNIASTLANGIKKSRLSKQLEMKD